MSIKHALVVDDSKAARVALKRLLEGHALVVDLAESGEEALEFLKHQAVDVIFMDHTMPGMDGLQAVTAIKNNPRTAGIPVMMYTTQEGELYVGQARALGAAGVLPKAVHPQALFETLLRLGLVKDKRTGAPAPQGARRDRRTGDPGARAPEDTVGLPLESLLRRVIDDQYELRTALADQQRTFARTVADEVVEAQRAAGARGLPASRWRQLATALALVALGFGGGLYVTFDQNRALVDKLQGPASPATDARMAELDTALHTARTESRAHYLALVDALQWAINRHASSPWDGAAFDETRSRELDELLDRLHTVGFSGRVRVESHLGEFCLVNRDDGSPALAPPDLPVEACGRIGHPLDESSRPEERQSVEFAEWLATSPRARSSTVAVELVAHDREHSLRRDAFPADTSLAGDWNRIAERNNRVEYTLIPTN
jgi:CheY-like chemotaxis protein